jgi:hypothetical protein
VLAGVILSDKIHGGCNGYKAMLVVVDATEVFEEHLVQC